MLLAFSVISPGLAIVGPAAPAPGFAAQVMMVLARSAKSAGFCTGTVLSPTKLLTAAHCVGLAEDMRVHYRDGQNTPVLLDVKSVAIHPDFHAQAPKTREKSIDLAIVTLAKPLPDRFEPADLTQPQSFELGDSLTLAGFGVTHEGQAASSGTLSQGAVTLRAPKSEVLFWLEGPRGLGACTGDSGGPVFFQGALVGVISWTEGMPPAHCGKLTQAIRLKNQMNWVKAEMRR
eukprot:gene9567-9643_t